MKYKKENLIKLLKLVEEISRQPGNEWFLEGLQNKFSENERLPNPGSETLEAKINLIRDYLSIDLNRVIDYSYFEEPTRESLFRDCIEMGRYEKGAPSHKIDFGEFCRYAHLQAEGMINYFFNKISNQNINIVDRFIQGKVTTYKPTKNPTEIHHIFYTHKLSAFKSISQMSKKSVDVFWFLNEYRNELSHRNSLTTSSEDKDLVLYEKSGFINAQVDFRKLDDKQKEIYNRGKYVITKRKKDFNLIYDSIEDLKKQIIDSLFKLKELPSSKTTFGNANPLLQEIKNKLDRNR
jgi:hypothetical protein